MFRFDADLERKANETRRSKLLLTTQIYIQISYQQKMAEKKSKIKLANRTHITNAVQRFAAQFDYEIVEYKCAYKEYLAYLATSETLKGAFYGYPIFVIIRSDFCCRFATPDEVIEIISIVNNARVT